MNTDKVFTAFDKEGNELLLYRKDNDTYIDLNSDNNEIIEKDKIDLETLALARKSVDLHKHMLASSIKRKYKKDRSELVNTKEILFGIECTIENLKETKIFTGWIRGGIPINDYHYKWKENQNQNLNLYRFKREVEINDYKFNIYINLFDKKEYLVFNNTVKNICHLPSFGNGMKYIYANDITLEDSIKESVIEKKKVYEYAYEARKTKITD